MTSLFCPRRGRSRVPGRGRRRRGRQPQVPARGAQGTALCRRAPARAQPTVYVHGQARGPCDILLQEAGARLHGPLCNVIAELYTC
jgi:hypothetical protein